MAIIVPMFHYSLNRTLIVHLRERVRSDDEPERYSKISSRQAWASELLYSDGCNTVRVAIGNTSLSTLLEVVR